ncbi:MAG TPA: hypothetical protein VMA83_07215 [Solirubrobacteraceae bacterium]|nr:hypothetical protein [Solirubrobacteraceae bacterium]
MRWLALALTALALAGCESSQEKSAQLEKEAKAKAAKLGPTEHSVKIQTPSKYIQVVSASALHGSETDAVAIVLRNESSKGMGGMPIQFVVKGNGGQDLYTNATPGLASDQTTVPVIPAHGILTWVDDQVTYEGTVEAVNAVVGEGRPSDAHEMAVSAVHLESESGSEFLTGTVTNKSSVAQHGLSVFAFAKRGTSVVAAGTALVQTLAPGQSQSFQVFPAGASPKGTQLSAQAPANL